jgi:hypothetical protein
MCWGVDVLMLHGEFRMFGGNVPAWARVLVFGCWSVAVGRYGTFGMARFARIRRTVAGCLARFQGLAHAFNKYS